VSPTYIGHPIMKRKKGEIKAWDIPYWGKAKDIADVFNAGIKEGVVSNTHDVSEFIET